MKFANIIVDISHDKLDRPFSYRIPEELEGAVLVGSLVEVPFGNGNRRIRGYVIEIVSQIAFDLCKVKDVICVIQGSIPLESQLISLAGFIREQYGCTMNQALKTVIPVKKEVRQIEEKYISLGISQEEAGKLLKDYAGRKNMAQRMRVLKALGSRQGMAWKETMESCEVSAEVLRAMGKQGIISIRKENVYRDPVHIKPQERAQIVLNREQEAVVKAILEHPGTVHLLHGVTGSGKTEVYMELIAAAIARGKEVIVLIPEIGLTYQTISRFYSRFPGLVSIMNSRMSQGERYDQFERAKSGKVQIMVGPRSALFTPFRNLGLLIIDEEHESAYKSDRVPKYHARETGIYRASLTGATVVLGSATPSVYSYYKAKKGEFMLHTLTRRANDMELPEAVLVDLRQELAEGNRDIFSRTLMESISDRLQKNEQILLFINRRGYSGFVSCRACGTVMKCPHCDVSLTFHGSKKQGTLLCHYCGYHVPLPNNCSHCGSPYFGRFGIGTQQIEERIHQLFPEAVTLRMDYDTTRDKDGHEKILKTFAAGEADILIGTQMIVKGHDFPKVTLVGVIAADLSLYAPDYQAGERTFQLLTQAVGRAGRGTLKGQAIIQTYHPEEAVIQNAMHQDYEAFYETEIGYRSLMGYPPCEDMLGLMVSGQDEQKVRDAIEDLGRRIENSKISGLRMIGPAKAGISKIQDVYRYVIYLKHKETGALLQVQHRLELYWSRVEAYQSLQVQFDFNPMGEM